MVCANCGEKVNDDAKFCKHCGSAASAAFPSYVAKEEEAAFPLYVAKEEEEEKEVDSGPPRDEYQSAGKKRGNTPLIAVLCILLVVAVAAVGLVYNNNYEALLAAIGFRRETATEPSAGETEPASPVWATDPPYTFPRATETTSRGSGAVTIPSKLYRIDTRSPIDHTPLRIRSGPSVEFEKIGIIPDLQVVVVTQLADDWAFVTYEGISGWAYLEFMVPID